MSGFLRDFIASLADRRPWRGEPPTAGRLAELARDLLSGRGEASGVALARELLGLYQQLEAEAKTALLEELSQSFGPDREQLRKAAAAYLDGGSENAEAELRAAAEPQRQELLRRLNLAPHGTALLVAMRQDLLARLREHPKLAVLDADFAHLFSSWFNRGFLVMRRIDWHTPAAILEKVMRYEAVHPFRDWQDLRRRIDLADRRLYAFFHPALADEPLIFVQVALTTDVPEAIGPVLAVDRQPIDDGKATTAVFYSITNTQDGLRGISFGNFLIKQVVEDLCREFPGLKRFVTLSPAPGFRRWLDAEISAGSPLVAELPVEMLREGDWNGDADKAALLRPALQTLAAHYYVRARDRAGRVVDPVARFHLGNGARLEQINWPADRSEQGLRQSYGLMVNYLYELKTIEKNHEAYANAGKVVASPAVMRRLKGVPEPVATAPPST